MIITITSISQLNGILSKDKEKLSVIDFHATWCGPCHAIAPAYEALSNQYTSVNFFKCDVDKAFEVARVYAISAMPTFIFLKGSTKVDQLKGASKTGLETTLQKHAVIDPASTAFSGKGNTLGGGPEALDAVGDGKLTLNKISAWFTQLDPQLRVLLGLVGLYLVFWSFR
jgi:thioredoxin 1